MARSFHRYELSDEDELTDSGFLKRYNAFKKDLDEETDVLPVSVDYVGNPLLILVSSESEDVVGKIDSLVNKHGLPYSHEEGCKFGRPKRIWDPELPED